MRNDLRPVSAVKIRVIEDGGTGHAERTDIVEVCTYLTSHTIMCHQLTHKMLSLHSVHVGDVYYHLFRDIFLKLIKNYVTVG